VARYLQTQKIDEPLAMLRSGTTSYYHADGLRSVTSLSSAAGSIANTYTYDSFGNLAASTGSLVNSFRYTGREFDSEIGLYYYRARYFDPSAGRFLSEDHLHFQGEGNFYRYAKNNPLLWSDPSGNSSQKSDLCFDVTPSGMTEKPCTDPNGGTTCIDVPTGQSCLIPVPSGPPLPPLPPDHNSDCWCTLKRYYLGQDILSEQQVADARTLGFGITVSGGLTGLEHVVPKVVGRGILGLDLAFLGHDLYDIWKHYKEAGEKLDRLRASCP